MYDYTKALHERFRIRSRRSDELSHAAEEARENLRAELNREQRKLLLRFVDAEDHRREQEEFDSFLAGFCLADGIRAELRTLPAYSFDDESEAQAREAFEQNTQETID